jgi:hypothetical protein
MYRCITICFYEGTHLHGARKERKKERKKTRAKNQRERERESIKRGVPTGDGQKAAPTNTGAYSRAFR